MLIDSGQSGNAMHKHLYQRFLSQNQGTLNFAAHSHHYWPDATRDAMLQYWDDTARLVGHKWEHVFGEVVPEAQQHVARCLDLPDPERIVFGTSTHEFACRVMSCFPADRPIRLLTTDSEFYSFRRQMVRMAEDNIVVPHIVATDPIESFTGRFIDAANSAEFDLIYLSHVFFNSGFAHDLGAILTEVPFDRTQVIVDAYHSFCALPASYAGFGDHVFVTGGGYKYAQGGEGACFLSVPRDCSLRPANTGWFSAFSALESGQAGEIQYGTGGQRFAGATFDPTGMYRFNAAMSAVASAGLTIAGIHDYVIGLQQIFLQQLDALDHRYLNRESLIFCPARPVHGHFFTFQLPSASETAAFAKELEARRIEIDYRADRMRFGFGLYQDESDVHELFDRITASR